MDFTIPQNHKFGCVVLHRAGVDYGLKNSLEVSPGLWAVFGPPFELDHGWKEWLGSLRSELVSECNLALVAVAPSSTLHVLDIENQALQQKALSFFYALLLAQIFHYDDALIISGAVIEDRENPLSIRSVSNLARFYRPPGALIETIGQENLLAAPPVVEGILSIHIPGNELPRLGRGFHAWIQGMQEEYGSNRLHQFVRSLEALAKTDVGRSTSQFAHRCQLFAGNSASASELLLDLYKLRGDVEHMNRLSSALQEGLERSFQTQVLASHAYLRIFSDPGLRTLFSSDDRIDAFWKRPWSDQVAVWGAPVDVSAAVQQRFNRDLIF